MSQSTLFSADEIPLADKPPVAFRVLPKRLDVEYCCPRCAYAWAGPPKAGAATIEFDPDAEETP